MYLWVIGNNLLTIIFLDGISAQAVIILWGIEALRAIEGQWPVTCPAHVLMNQRSCTSAPPNTHCLSARVSAACTSCTSSSPTTCSTYVGMTSRRYSCAIASTAFPWTITYSAFLRSISLRLNGYVNASSCTTSIIRRPKFCQRTGCDVVGGITASVFVN